jgi:hypothetical protein
MKGQLIHSAGPGQTKCKLDVDNDCAAGTSRESARRLRRIDQRRWRVPATKSQGHSTKNTIRNGSCTLMM